MGMRNAMMILALGLALVGGVGCGLLQQGSATPAEGQQLADLEALAEEMTQALAAGNMAGVTGNYTAEMQRALPEEKLREVWNDYLGGAGALQKVDGKRHAFIKGFNVIFVDIQFASQSGTLQYTFDGDGKLSGLYIRPYGFSFD
jgi:hypothetical protein